MSPARQWLYWSIALGVVLLGIALLSDILFPFIVGLAIAYILDPVVDKLEERRIGRGFATLIVLTLFFAILTVCVVMLLPVLFEQIIGFAQSLPNLLAKGWDMIISQISETADDFDLVVDVESDAQAIIDAITEKAGGVIAGLLESVWSSGLAFFNILSLVLISPLIAFYLLRDWDHMVAKVESWLPRHLELEIKKVLAEIHSVLSGFVRGQGMVCLLLGTFYAIGLTLVGLDFGLVIGLIAGLVSFIPFVGVIVGLTLSMLTAFTQFWPDFVQIAIVGSIFVAGQVLEGNFLTPKLLGNRVGLHPVWVIFGLFAGGTLFGFVGVLMSIPITAVIGVLVRYSIQRYVSSGLFLGEASEVSDEESAQ